jgi:hypothetical protein
MSIPNFLIALCGAIALGWYNAVIRHDAKTDELRTPWRSIRAEAPVPANGN